MNTMSSLKEVRRQNLNLILASLGGHGAQKRLSKKTGIYHTHISNLRLGNKEMGEEIARKIEVAMALSSGWMDQLHSAMQDDQGVGNVATPEAIVMEEQLLALWEQLPVERQQVALEVLTDMVLAENCRQQNQHQTQIHAQTQFSG